MKVLVTGGAGFIGSNFIRHMLNKYSDCEVVNLDKLTYAGNLDNLRDIENDRRYRFVKGDICDSEVVNELAKEVDVVINFAAESVSKDVYLPVWKAAKIEILTLEELFGELSKDSRNKIIKKDKVEVINLKHTNYKALSYKGGIGYWMPIKQISRHRYKGRIIRLTQKWGEIEVTPNHSIYDCDFNLATPLENPEVLALRNINHLSKKDKYQDFSGDRLKSLLRIFGAYIAEGWTSYNKANGSYHFGISNGNRDWIKGLGNDLSSLGYQPNTTSTKDGLYQLVISNKDFYHFVRKQAGHGSHDKFIPSFIFQLKKEFQEEFLSVLIEGDGEVIQNKNHKTVRYTTVSRKLATGLSLLLTLLGYNYSVVKDNRFNAYTMNFGGDYTISLLTKKYEVLDYDDYVYDISVENLEDFACGVGNVVVHNTHVDRSIIEAGSFVNTDVFGTYILLEAVKKHQLKRFIHISTDEVYGSIDKGSFKETDSLSPSSPYSASKAGGDMLVMSYWTTYRLPVMITRSSNNFGPYQYPEKLIPLFITNALDDEALPLYGDGKNVRDWIYVLDNVEAIDFVLHHGELGEIYNIGGGNEETNIEITETILKELKKPKDLIRFVEDRPGHDLRYSLDCAKVRQLGWKPRFNFSEAMEETIKWYKENERWWRKIKSGEFKEYYHKMYVKRGEQEKAKRA